MKKFQMMMATVLVALMAFAVQSCGSDDKDDLSASDYQFAGAFSVQEKGELTDTDIAYIKDAFAKSVTGSFLTDKQAESETDRLVQQYMTGLREYFKKSEEASTAKFTITFTMTKVKTQNVVCKWDVVCDKGSVSGQKY